MRLLRNRFWRATWICLLSPKAGTIARMILHFYVQLQQDIHLTTILVKFYLTLIQREEEEVVFFKSSLRVTQVQLTIAPSSFETLSLSIATPRGPVTLLTVYRRDPVLRHLLFNSMRNLRQCWRI